VSYFSIVPGGPFVVNAAPDTDALVALPLVGAAIGAVAGFTGEALARVAPHPIAAAGALVVLVVLSGAIHLDGFLDGCDAFFASVPPARRLEILKDPRHGSFAAAGLLCLGVTWFAALSSLPAAAYPGALALAGGLGRAAAISNAFIFSYSQGGKLPVVPYGLALLAIGWGGYLVAPAAVLFIPVAIVLSLGLGRWISGRLDGVLPGDGYGFIAILLDVGTLCALTVLLAAGRTGGGA
jgi:adenosylcobinamide-GDP ribazoletransferase